MELRAVTFDCWGTLIFDSDPVAATQLRIRDLCDIVGISEEEASALWAEGWQTHVQAWQRHEQFGSIGVARFIADRYALSNEDMQRVLRSCEETTMSVGVGCVDGAVEVLEALRSAGLRTALVCDTGLTPGHIVRKLLDGHGILPLLDALAFSDEVGVPKPDARMFQHAIDSIGGGPAMHVGDLRRTDVAGSRNFGMRSVRFKGIYNDESDHPEADHVISDLREIVSLVGLPAA
ncbi:MAG: HAD family hydrolase [Actinomycetota bacterium]